MTEAVQTTEAAPAAPVGPTLEEAVVSVFGPQDEPVAAEPAKEEATAEPANDAPAEEPKADKVGARIAAAKRAEQKAERERIEIRQAREQQERRNAELDAREKRLRLIEDDPVKFFEEFKADPKTFLDKLAGEYKPENVVTKKLSAVEEELQRVKTELAQRDVATRQAQARAQADSAWKDASASFIAHVGEQADKYPSLTEAFTEDQATEKAFSVLTEVVGRDRDGSPITRTEAYRRQFGEYPDHDVVAEYLETLAKQELEARSKSAWRKRGESAEPASKAALNGDSRSVPMVKGTSPRTLSSRDTNQRASAPKPWSQEAADEESIRILEAAFRKRA